MVDSTGDSFIILARSSAQNILEKGLGFRENHGGASR